VPARNRALVLAIAAALSVAASGPVAAQDVPGGKPPAAAPEPVNHSDEDAARALERFDREFATPDLSLRREAFQALRKVLHPKIAQRLFDLAVKHAETPVRTEAMKALGMQAPSRKVYGPKVSKWLSDEAENNRKAKARGDYGLPIDPKTGESDSTSPEGLAALRRKRDRGALLSEGVKVLDRFEYREKDGIETLSEFLQDGNDDLVAGVLGMLGKWQAWTALWDVHELFDMYPEEDRCETGSVSVDTGAAGGEDAAKAKRKWMAKYGDPDKRRPRPKVVKAIKACIKAVTGEEFTEPKQLYEYLKRPDIKRKVKAK
jgi:hypothetical protein